MVILIIKSGEKMRFKSLIKLSLVASVAVCANAAGESVLSGVEVTSSSGGYGVDDIKISTRNAGLVKDVMRDIPGCLCWRHKRHESKNLHERRK